MPRKKVPRFTQRQALELCRKFLKGKCEWHIWINYPAKPELTLGDAITSALKKRRT